MVRITAAIMVLALSLLVLSAFAQDIENQKVSIVLPERSVVPVKLIQSVKGDQLLVGQSVDFVVSRDIIIDGFVVIKRGAPAYGTITSAEKAGYVSKGGKINLSIDYCKAIDGSKVYLKAILSREAEDHMGANIAASIIVCPLILLVRGDESELPEGLEFKSYVENDSKIAVPARAKLSDEDLKAIEAQEQEEQRMKEEKAKQERERIEKERKEKEKEERRGFSGSGH